MRTNLIRTRPHASSVLEDSIPEFMYNCIFLREKKKVLRATTLAEHTDPLACIEMAEVDETLGAFFAISLFLFHHYFKRSVEKPNTPS